MEYLLTAKQMKMADTFTQNEIGLPGMVLMERAALAIRREAERLAPVTMGTVNPSVFVFAGNGNNGGDGLAAARLLNDDGYHVRIFCLSEKLTQESNCEAQMKIINALGIRRETVSENASQTSDAPDIVIDALFGTGLSRNIEGKASGVVDLINYYHNNGSKVISVDIPSGVNADDGSIMGNAVRADVTVTFGFRKLGNVLFPGAECCGKVVLEDIGIPVLSLCKCEDDHINYAYTMDRSDIAVSMKRPEGSNKGNFGKTLIIAGSHGMAGSSILCAKAAMNTGAGMVRLFSSEDNRVIIQETLPEVMFTGYDKETEEDELRSLLRNDVEWADSIAAGPGIGTGDMAQMLMRVLAGLSGDNCFDGKTLILDADALNIIAADSVLREKFAAGNGSAGLIVTPHPGELARLCGTEIDEVLGNRVDLSSALACELNCTVVSKDARTWVVDKSGRRFLNTCGNDGMATAGSGDVLTGITAAVAAMGVRNSKTIYQSACMSVLIHAVAGDEAAELIGRSAMRAGDIACSISKLLP